METARISATREGPDGIRIDGLADPMKTVQELAAGDAADVVLLFERGRHRFLSMRERR